MSVDVRCPSQPAAEAAAQQLTVLAATRLEAWIARWALPPSVPVRRVGVGLRRMRGPVEEPFIACGLAGGLSDDLRPGAVVVPHWVALPSGQWLPCWPPLVEALRDAVRELGFEPTSEPLLTAPSLLTGPARAAWRDRGFGAVDMETGLLLRQAPRGATVRVVLDTTRRELAPGWERPGTILLDPRRWSELLWLSRAAPAYAWRAASVVRVAVQGGLRPPRSLNA